MTGSFEVRLRECDVVQCRELARWESYTELTYSAHCDGHRPDAANLVDQRHCPRGVLWTGAISVIRETT